MKHINLLDFLSEGEENAKTARELSQLLGCDSIRDITAEVARLRKSGQIICSVTDSDNKGYFLPANKDEVRQFVRRTESRIIETQKMLRPALEYLADER